MLSNKNKRLILLFTACCMTACKIVPLSFTIDKPHLHQAFSSVYEAADLEKIDSARIYKCEISNHFIEIDQTVDYGSLIKKNSELRAGYKGFDGDGQDMYLLIVYSAGKREPDYYYISLGYKMEAKDQEPVKTTTFVGTCYKGIYSGVTPESGKTQATLEFSSEYKIKEDKKKNVCVRKINTQELFEDKMLFVLSKSRGKESIYTTYKVTKVITPGGNKIGGRKAVVYDIPLLIPYADGFEFTYDSTIYFKNQ